MSREVRMVPKGWVHPVYVGGRPIPLFDNYNSEDADDWDEERKLWDSKEHSDFIEGCEFSEWAGGRPDKNDYMPIWSVEEKTHLMMYETTSEGCPISPAFETPEELAKWLADNEASAFGGSKGTYEGWLRVAKGGFAPSMIMSDKGIQSGVDAL
tara:strand:+ start:85 stop:546 length:462 start_codon:yes stop_codon:yes gene_type:complete